jgi:hypothetical protein
VSWRKQATEAGDRSIVYGEAAAVCSNGKTLGPAAGGRR